MMTRLSRYTPYVEKAKATKGVGAVFFKEVVGKAEETDLLKIVSEGLALKDVRPYEHQLAQIVSTERNPESVIVAPESHPGVAGVLEDIVARRAVVGVWQSIMERYGNAESFKQSLEGKEDYAKVYKVGKEEESYITEELELFLSSLAGVSVGLADGEVCGKEEFEKVLKLEEALASEKPVTEEVRQAVENLLQRMDVLYRGMLNNNYVGIILPNGNLVYSSSQKEQKKAKDVERLQSYIKAIAEAWYGYVGVEADKVGDVLAVDMSYDVLPRLHKEFLKSESTWQSRKKALKEHLTKELMGQDKENYQGYVEQLERTLTTSLFLGELNEHTMQLRATQVRDIDHLKEGVRKALERNVTGAQVCNILTNQIDTRPNTRDIINMTCIYNMNKFEKEILFAHKLYTGPNPVVPKRTQAVLGVKFDGSYATENLNSYMYMSIIAGSRSGKGTLTMSLLAPLLADGAGVVYLDNKPDIASLFWNMERNMAAKGEDVRFLAIDSDLQKSDFDGAVGNRGIIQGDDGLPVNLLNVPEGINPRNLLPLRTYKVLQMAMLLGRIRPRDPDMDDGVTYIFIDEATLLTQRLASLYIELEAGMKEKKENPELAEYCESVVKLLKATKDAFSAIALKKGRENLRFVLVGQCPDGQGSKAWDVASSPTIKGLGAPRDNIVFDILGATELWLSGREQVNARNYKLTQEEREMANKPGSFLVHRTKPSSSVFKGVAKLKAEGTEGDITRKNSTMFRSYFALVNNDYNKDMVEAKYNEGYDALNTYLNDNTGAGFTPNFLTNVLANNETYYSDGTFDKAMSELYDENGLVEGVGFEGLIESVVRLKGLDRETYIKGLNSGYNRIHRIYEKMGLAEKHGYSCLEEYLFDCSADSFYTNEEILDMYCGVVKSKGGAGVGLVLDIAAQEVDEDVDSDDAYADADEGLVTLGGEMDALGNAESEKVQEIEEEFSEKEDALDCLAGEEKEEALSGLAEEKEEALERAAEEVERKRQELEEKRRELEERKRQKEREAESLKAVSPNASTGDVYKGLLEVPVNPFETYDTDKWDGQVQSFRVMEDLIIKDIEKVVGGLERVAMFRMNGKGVITVNDISYMPTFEDGFLETVPFALRGKLEQGIVSDFFDFRHLLRAKGLQSLEIEHIRVARGPARQQFGLKPRQRYSVLFDRMQSLYYINVAGVEYKREGPDVEDEVEQGGGSGRESVYEEKEGLGEKMSKIFGMGEGERGSFRPSPIESPMFDSMMQSRPVKIITNAAGWTVGIKAVTVIASLFGGWGLVFGGLAAAGAYSELSKGSRRGSPPTNGTGKKRTGGKKKDKSMDEY